MGSNGTPMIQVPLHPQVAVEILPSQPLHIPLVMDSLRNAAVISHLHC